MATQGDGPKSRVNPKYLAVLAIVLFGSAAIAGFYSFGMQGTGTTKTTSTTSSTTTACAAAAPAVDQQLVPKTFGAITEYTLSANRTPERGSGRAGRLGLVRRVGASRRGPPLPQRHASPSTVAVPRPGFDEQLRDGRRTSGASPSGTARSGEATSFYSRLVGVNPATGQTQQIDLANDTTPYTLAVSPNNYLWFTASKLGAPDREGEPDQRLRSTYYNLPTAKYWESVYMLFKNSTIGYVLALDGTEP